MLLVGQVGLSSQARCSLGVGDGRAEVGQTAGGGAALSTADVSSAVRCRISWSASRCSCCSSGLAPALLALAWADPALSVHRGLDC